MHENEVAYTILQNLPVNTPFEAANNLINGTVKTVQLQICEDDTAIVELYLSRWPFDELVTRAIMLTLHNLVSILDDPESHDLFVRNCIMAQLSTRTMRLAGYMFQAAQALAWAMKKPIPMAARPYLQGWKKETVEKNLPLEFVLPHQEETRSFWLLMLRPVRQELRASSAFYSKDGLCRSYGRY
ncbi:hypothetical protein AK830_g3526 [Neonectria ditissima]|uniref:Uncharacterized protein n=1 Tax=Neonectria ditissima TaxID=78410 RepID=A0A0N8H7Y3_9HYPO|nr:hypothetical protein AK830_g3526 [Neonectria ditissima]